MNYRHDNLVFVLVCAVALSLGAFAVWLAA